MEFLDCPVMDLNQVVKVTCSPNTRKTENWMVKIFLGGFVIRDALTQILVSK